MDATLTWTNPYKGNQANFDGMMLCGLAYGAMIMLYIQVIQVMLRRPKRTGRTFWFIIAYSTILFPLTTMAFGGKFKFTESLYVALSQPSNVPINPKEYWLANSQELSNIISESCTTLIPWFGDGIMLYRLMVIWNYKWKVLIFPGLMYFTRIGLSIPILLGQTQAAGISAIRTREYMLIFYSLCLSMNIYLSIAICARLYMLRHKAEKVLGNLQASLYNSFVTMFVESGSFFTIWSMVYVISFTRNGWVQDIFLQPYSYIIAVTRMLIILRIAQGRAWSREIINAADDGILDWEVSSTSSGPVDMSEQAHQRLPKKFLDNSFNSSKSTLGRHANA